MSEFVLHCYDVSAMFKDAPQPPDVLKVNDDEFIKVVRCKDCKYWNDEGLCKKHSSPIVGAIYGTDADDYCSEGERKDDE